MPKLRRLIWDIETSPNIGAFWRAGYKVRIAPENIIRERAIICISYKWEGEAPVYSLTWSRGDDKPMLKKFMRIALQADELIAHNGDRYDIKWLAARCLFHNLEAYPEWKTVDTLAIARRRFELNSYRLDYIAQLLFGKGEGKSRTEFDWWLKITLDNCQESLARMVEYCERDVILLERIWQRFEPFHKPKSHVGVMGGGEKWSCPWTGSEQVRKNKTKVTTAGTVRHEMISTAVQPRRYYTISDSAYQAYLEHKEDERRKEREARKGRRH